MKDIASSRSMLILTYLRLIFSFTDAFIITLFAVYAEKSLLLVPSLIALLFGVRGLTNMLSRIPSGKLIDRIGHRRPILLALIMLTLAYLMISETENIYVLILAMATYGIGTGTRLVADWFLLGECAPSRTRNIATAYFSTIFNIGTALGAVTGGAISLIFDMQTIFKLASLIIFTGILFIPLIKIGTNAHKKQIRRF